MQKFDLLNFISLPISINKNIKSSSIIDDQNNACYK